MKKFNIYALFIVALTLGLASCTKDTLYRPGGAETHLNNDETTPPGGDDIVIPEDDEDPPPPIKGKG